VAPRRAAAAAIVAAGVTAALGVASAATPGAHAGITAHPGSAANPAAVHRSAAATSSHVKKLRQVKHVFLIVLENKDYANSFGSPSTAPYLAKALRKRGLLLKNYYGTGHASLDNYVSLVSGQAPNGSTQADCVTFADFPVVDQGQRTPGEPDQQLGMGCVYPSDIDQIGHQLTAAHHSWKGYMDDMGNIPSREAAACGHPAIGARDETQTATTNDGYATRHDPFVYFHDVVDHHAYCRHHVVALGTTHGGLPQGAKKGQTGLATDLKHASTTPAYSFITPNLCNDGHDYPCRTGQKSRGSAQADIDHWLKVWVPRILHSPAYRKNGLIEITFDESDGPQSDSTACCGEGVDPNTPTGDAGETGPGGGRIGALLISPFLKAGTSSTHPYNHYSTLATFETIFGLKKLGYAQTAHTFPASLFRRQK
jgi:hypothetical protein